MKNKISLRYLVPNFFTVVSLVSALIALNFIADGEFTPASLLVIFSMICDYLDGKTARLLNASSRFGMQLDIISDFFAFGVVPAFLIYRNSLRFLGLLGILACILYVIAGAFRLVRFSYRDPDLKIKSAFEGLPIPAAAGLVVSFFLISDKFIINSFDNWVFFAVLIVMSVLMVSRIEYLAVENKGRFLYIILGCLLILLFTIFINLMWSFIVFLVLMTIYILFGLIRHFYKKYKQE